jgi:hypothetical protein
MGSNPIKGQVAGRIRPLADSKQATNKKAPPDWDFGAGLLSQDYPASLEGTPKERLPPDSRQQSSGLKLMLRAGPHPAPARK